MLPKEDLECLVCTYDYSRSDHVPRILHCNHTFCGQCLERISIVEGPLLTVTCPLCRWITCTSARLTLPSSLWVNTEIWDQLSDPPKEDTNEDSTQKDTEMKDSPLPNPQPRPSGLKGALENLRRVFKGGVKQQQRHDC